MSKSLLWATGSHLNDDFLKMVWNRDQQTIALRSNLAHHLLLYPLQSWAPLQQSSTESQEDQDVPHCPYFSLCSQHLPPQPMAAPYCCTKPVIAETFTLGTPLLVTSGHLALESQYSCWGLRKSPHLCLATRLSLQNSSGREKGVQGSVCSWSRTWIW